MFFSVNFSSNNQLVTHCLVIEF